MNSDGSNGRTKEFKVLGSLKVKFYNKKALT